MGMPPLNESFHTTVILAMSADGKIADHRRSAARFPSAEDKAHLEAAIAPMDAVIFGAGTLRAYGTSVLIKSPTGLKARSQQSQPPQPVHIVCSASGQLVADWPFFRQPFDRGLITTPAGRETWGDRPGFDQIWVMTPAMSWVDMVTPLRSYGIHKIALLGGGSLVAQWLAADLVDELKLTICPLLLGGTQAPSPVDGAGWLAAQAPRLSLVSSQAIADEVFLHYRVQPFLRPSKN